jgi:hypothetical protein
MGENMTETELLQISISAASTLLEIISLFFGLVSAYIVALYLFLYGAPITLRLLAFLLVTLAFIFIAAMGWNLQYLGEGIHHAWAALSHKTTGLTTLGPPFIVRTIFIDGQFLTAWIAWGVGFSVYLMLAYLTFFFRWPERAAIE